MKKLVISIIPIVILSLFLLAGCGPKPAGESGTEIIDAEEALAMINEEGTVLVDAQNSEGYAAEHVQGAVSIARSEIVIMKPYPNLLAPADVIENVMTSRGVSNDTMVVVYDNNKNMDSARLWWTLKAYGHHKVKVVSGGLEALKAAGAETTTETSNPAPALFKAGPLDESMIAKQSDLRRLINTPDPNTVLIDTRTLEEYNEGTIPGSKHLDFSGNNFKDNTYKPVQQIRIRYLEEGIDYDKTAIMYCKTSIRGAQTYLALYNAGYRNLKLYDGAWVEWSANPMNQIFIPEVPVQIIESSDNS